MGWSIICRLDRFLLVFQALLVFLLWLHYLRGTVFVHCLILFLSLFLTSMSQLVMQVSVQWYLYLCSIYLNLSFLSRWKVLLFQNVLKIDVLFTFILQLGHLPIVKDNYLFVRLLKKSNLSFQLHFLCSWICFQLRNPCVIFYPIFVNIWSWWFLPEATSECYPC